MGSIQAVREALPDRQNEGPETRRPSRMRETLRHRHRLPVLVALIGSLAVASLVFTSVAWARPYTLDPGPDPTSGDPTGDDQPSPTPKPKNLVPSISIRGERAVVTEGGALVRVIGSWQWFVRYLDLLPVR